MTTAVRTILPKWLMAALVSLWGLWMLPYLTGAALHLPAAAAILLLWTALTAAVDYLSRPLWSWALLAAVFAAFRGGPLVEAMVLLHSGGLLEPTPAGDAAALLELAALACAAYCALARFWPRAAVSLLWTGYWIWAALEERPVPKPALAAMVPILLFTLAEGLHRLDREGRRERFADLAPVLLGLFTAAGALLLVLPTSPEPYGYPILNAILDKAEALYDDAVTHLFYRQGGEGEFSMAFAGYSDEADTGQGVSGSRELSGAMLAKAQHELSGPLYLIGNSWDSFDGRSWRSGLNGDEDGLLDWNMDTAERIYALWRYQQGQETPLGVTNYFKNTSVYLRYQEMSTRTLFTVPNTTRVTTDTQRFPWSAGAGRVLFDYLQTRDTYYRVYYLAQNQRLLPELIRAEEGYAYSEENTVFWRKVFSDYRAEFGLTLDVFDTDRRVEPILARRQALIYDRYLTLPEDLSDQVRTLAEDITRDCATSYEKLTAIAAYLQSHYDYTTEPEPVPEDASFLDYVLFQAGEGYCTWYATAATLLARCVGVPARYVQGYCLELPGGVLTAVDGSSSHAWCEGYIPGFGWVTVEATPGAESGVTWGEVSDAEDAPAAPAEEPEELAPPAGPTGEAPRAKLPRWVPAATALAALLAALAMLPRWIRFCRQCRRATCSQRAVLALERFLRTPFRRAYRRRDSESLRQYFARLRWTLHLEPERMETMTALGEEVLFAGRQLTEEELTAWRGFLRELRRAIRKGGEGY